MTYDEWITEHYSTYESAYGHCAEATLQMQGAFPELRRERGHFVCAAWGERAHWWLVAPDGAVVDPTRAQFPGPGYYVPWVEGAPEPSGKCPNCGDLVFDGGTVCSDDCAREYAAYLTGR